MPRTILPGRPSPLGATPYKRGTNFALYSENASAVHLCLYDEQDRETDRIQLKEHTAFVWHGVVLGIKPGQHYGFRVDGAWKPEEGLRFNKNKLLVDPYAKAISGQVDWSKPIFPYPVESGNDLDFDDRDSADGVPKCIVVDSRFDWGDDCRPNVPLSDSIIYEVHVKGYSKSNPRVPENLRGTYAGLAHPESIDYLKQLGITTVELLPVHHFIDQGFLLDKGLSNYWGYDTLGFFAPMSRYCSAGDGGAQVNEFKQMVKDLHAAGLEVILDVVYNHTCEGNRMGPMLSFKGVDNTTYYRVVPDDYHYYMDYTGTGNTLNVRHPQVLKLLMDSLRYWVIEMHVDGFRFDLAAALARELHEVSKLSSFFDTIHQDPTLADVKLIAEPWDVGEGGYQVGQFPVLWAEWNGRYRDTVRSFWKGDNAQLSDFAYRLTGSSDLYQNDGRRPYASINFITAHDGFTLCDLVSYNDKHNEANGQNNQDGASDNRSWNMGAEGPTDDESVNIQREQQQRNFLATLMLSQGVPMLLGGDEVSRSQRGNNDCFCQDNELSWYDWNLDPPRKRLLEFTANLIQLRKRHPNLHRRRFFQDRTIRGSVVRDIAWYNSSGEECSNEDWTAEWNRSLGVMLNGKTLDAMNEDGIKVIDDSFLILINSWWEGVEFKLPPPPNGSPWKHVLDTANIDDPFADASLGDSIIVGGRSLVLLSDGIERE
jgi:isoamylase